MTQPATPATTSPLLKRFYDYSPGDIYAIAAKVHLAAGFEACKSNTLADAVWNDDKTALIVTFTNGNQTTLLLEGYRLLTKCSCKLWQPARNCPHVVVVWAALKRIVSPDALSHIQFNNQLLLDMKSYTGREAASLDSASTAGTAEKHGLKKNLSDARRMRNEYLNRKALSSVPPDAPEQFRLVIETNLYGSGVSGRIMRGTNAVIGWTTIGIPTDLTRFMASNYYYESSPRYFGKFIKLTGGKYPIVFRDAEARETTLAYHGDEPCKAGIAFDIRGNEVVISRSLDNGKLIPPGAIAHGHLLFVPETGAIHPITNLEVWREWEEIVEQLASAGDFYEFDEFEQEEEYGDDDDLEPIITSPELRRSRHGVVAPLPLFNSACIRFNSKNFDNAAENQAFFLNGSPVAAPQPGTPSYLLDIPHGMAQPRISLEPAGLYNGQTFPCSNTALKLLNPARRAILSGPMKARKRLCALLETAFALLDETKTTARNTIIRTLTASPDFSKREVRREAKSLLNHLVEEWDTKLALLLAAPEGWYCVEEDRRDQARLMKILFEMLGLDAFINDPETGGLQVMGERLLERLPHLISRLQAEGFSLRVGSEPLTAVSLDFLLDATTSGLDWFELRPEIRCDGELLSAGELQKLLEGDGMLRRDGRLFLLDEASAQILGMFAEAMPSGRRKRKGGQDPVRVPRLRILDWLDLRKHGVSVKLAPDDAKLMESLLNFEAIPERPLPSGLNATLRNYQADAYRWLGFLYEHRLGACLADDMGLGKTVQGIALLGGIADGAITSSAPRGAPHLIVVPPSLLFNWEAEIARFLPAAKTYIYTGQGRSKDAFADHDIIITSYGIVHRDIGKLEALRFNVIIFDETQVVKNLQAATTNAVRKLKGSFTLALTGTPVENHLGEYYAIMDLCLPGLLGSHDEFNRKVKQKGQTGIERLIRRTRPFVLRRSKQMIASELPAKIEIDIHLDLSPKQKALYQRTVEEVRGQVRDAFAKNISGQARIIALTAILRLRQICLAPALASAGASDASPKLDFLAEQLAELYEEGHSALVFSQFTGYLDIIEQGLKQNGLACLRLDGSTPVPQRKKLVRAFQNSETPSVFLISLKAGGKGLNLTRATYVYHMDPWWNPAVENQASDRAHRIGQTSQVTITRLIMRHTIEEKMMKLKEQKLKLYQAILEEGTAGGGSGLSREDFEFLLG